MNRAEQTLATEGKLHSTLHKRQIFDSFTTGLLFLTTVALE